MSLPASAALRNATTPGQLSARAATVASTVPPRKPICCSIAGDKVLIGATKPAVPRKARSDPPSPPYERSTLGKGTPTRRGPRSPKGWRGRPRRRGDPARPRARSRASTSARSPLLISAPLRSSSPPPSRWSRDASSSPPRPSTFRLFRPLWIVTPRAVVHPIPSTQPGSSLILSSAVNLGSFSGASASSCAHVRT